MILSRKSLSLKYTLSRIYYSYDSDLYYHTNNLSTILPPSLDLLSMTQSVCLLLKAATITSIHTTIVSAFLFLLHMYKLRKQNKIYNKLLAFPICCCNVPLHTLLVGFKSLPYPPITTNLDWLSHTTAVSTVRTKRVATVIHLVPVELRV